MECACICDCSGACRCCGRVKFREMFPVSLPGEKVPYDTRTEEEIDRAWELLVAEAEAARSEGS